MINNIIETVKSMFSLPKRETLEEIYLGQATNVAELERRMREIDRGEAPWNKMGRGGY